MRGGRVADAVGWASSFVLLLTIGSQVYKQWRDRTAKGVSRWLFAGQVAASAGFIVYSVMEGNAVFVFTNALILVSALIGMYVTARNRRHAGRRDDAAG